jgi:hypothetical protein
MRQKLEYLTVRKAEQYWIFLKKPKTEYIKGIGLVGAISSRVLAKHVLTEI